MDSLDLACLEDVTGEKSDDEQGDQDGEAP